jgi:hypothetical protein
VEAMHRPLGGLKLHPFLGLRVDAVENFLVNGPIRLTAASPRSTPASR